MGVPTPLGPRSARTAADDLPPAQAAVLRALDAQPEPTPVAALATAAGLHANTVREHLEALERAGLVERFRAAPQGRGRPAWLYAARDRGPEVAGGDREYAALAATLARAIHRTSDRPEEDAAAAGEEWGRQLARPHATRAAAAAAAAAASDAAAAATDTGDRAATARRTVIAVLDEVGFAPQADPSATDVRLTRCPLLAAAHEHPDVVCGVHRGLVRGALAELGSPAAEVVLVPFAEPGACRLTLRHDDRSDR